MIVGLHCDTINVASVVERLEYGGGGEQIVLCEQRLQAVDDDAPIAVGQLEALAQYVNDHVFGQHRAHEAVFLREQTAAYA